MQKRIVIVDRESRNRGPIMISARVQEDYYSFYVSIRVRHPKSYVCVIVSACPYVFSQILIF